MSDGYSRLNSTLFYHLISNALQCQAQNVKPPAPTHQHINGPPSTVTQTHDYTHTHIHTDTTTYTHTQIHTDTWTYTHTRLHRHRRTHKHAGKQTNTQVIEFQICCFRNEAVRVEIGPAASVKWVGCQAASLPQGCVSAGLVTRPVSRRWLVPEQNNRQIFYNGLLSATLASSSWALSNLISHDEWPL